MAGQSGDDVWRLIRRGRIIDLRGRIARLGRLRRRIDAGRLALRLDVRRLVLGVAARGLGLRVALWRRGPVG
jgi:hypothetical protein